MNINPFDIFKYLWMIITSEKRSGSLEPEPYTLESPGGELSLGAGVRHFV